MSKINAITNISVEGNSLIPYFDKYTKRYNLFIENMTNNIYINVTKEKNDDYVEGIGKVNLKQGINKIKIMVHKLNKEIEEYILIVHNGKIEEESNTYLEDLNIEGYNIDFKKDVLNYYINVTETEEIKVSYVPTSEYQNIKLEGTTNLKEGSNKIKVIVSNNNKKTIYIINVNRVSSVFKEKQLIEKTIFNKESLTKKEKIVIAISLSLICIVLIFFIYYILFILGRKTKIQHI